MLIGIVVFLVVSTLCILFLLYFKEYKDLMSTFSMLVKVLETRDLMLLRIIPELKNKREQKEIAKLVEDRINSKKQGVNSTIKADVCLNKKLKVVYEELNQSKNPIVREELKRIVRLEKSLKVLRREINSTVEEYNQNLLDHPKVCVKLLKMHPVNSYTIS